MSDIIDRIRDTETMPLSSVAARADVQNILQEAREEIERLRQFGRLTRGERRALEFAIGVYPLDDSIPATLRGLLERLK